MVRFENIDYLNLLWVLAPILVIFIIYMMWRKNTLARFGDIKLISQLMPYRSSYRHTIKFILLLLTIVCGVLALANPQIGTKYEKVKREGVDLIIALDVSKSMLAEDIKPSRLERSKLFISRVIDKLQNDRLGLIIFAGNAYLQMPITLDHSAGKLFLNTVSTDLVPTQGTAVGEAIRLAMEAFESGEKKHKVLVILTDGENHEGDAHAAVEEATKEGIVIHTIGVGTPNGAPIPLYRNKVQVDFKRDQQGNIVLSKMNETMLQQLAVKGDGKYYRLGAGNEELSALLKDIASMEKKEFEERVFTDFEDQFQYFVLIAFILLVIEILISERTRTWFSNWSIFQTEKR